MKLFVIFTLAIAILASETVAPDALDGCRKFAIACSMTFVKEQCATTCSKVDHDEIDIFWGCKSTWCGNGDWVAKHCRATCAKPENTCLNAGPQAPRDVTVGSTGAMVADSTPLDSTVGMVQVNTHFHLGAEHKSAGEYDEPMGFGFGCKGTTSGLATSHLAAYDFQYCKETEVGETYEFHFVYSTGGEKLGAGLGGAFATTSEPTIIVQGQVFVVVNDDTGAYDHDMLSGSTFDKLGEDIALYMGSTTGTSYNNNDKCSPYSINWNVDRKCQLLSAKSLDEVCRQMIELNMEADIHPHGSRELVSEALSVDTMLTKSN